MIIKEKIKTDPSAGFTLIEILVAAAISAIMMLMIYTSFRTTLNAVTDLTGYAEFHENINLTMFKMDRDIENLYISRRHINISLISDIRNNSSEISFVSANSLTFSFLGDMQTPTPVSDIREIGYLLIPDERTTGLNILVRREKNHYDDNPGTGGARSLLLENVISMIVEFRSGNDWTDRWDSTEHGRYPEAVRTTLSVRDYTDSDKEFSFISIPNMR